MPRMLPLPLLLAVLTSCSNGAAQLQVTAQSAPTGRWDQGKFHYGIHLPNGLAAVDYIYGSEGTWKRIDAIEYKYDYYDDDEEKKLLLGYANGEHFTTAPDANGILLFDANGDGKVDPGARGHAFHEHAGRGKNGSNLNPSGRPRRPFTNFWFDDNFLARFMSRAYGRPEPSGLRAGVTRWNVLNGDAARRSDGSNPDQYALDGMYFLGKNDLRTAKKRWRGMLDRLGARFDSARAEYAYPRLPGNYELGLAKVLNDQLLYSGALEGDDLVEARQHQQSLRTLLLARQQRNGATLLSWLTGDDTSLINTEATSCAVLGLGAGVRYAFEAGARPLTMGEQRGFLRQPGFVQAVPGRSQAGVLSNGPDWSFPAANYQVEFILRSSDRADQKMATLSVEDAEAGGAIARMDVFGKDLPSGRKWVALPLSFRAAAGHHYAFRVKWHGAGELELAQVLLR